ncbi:hypothetical protein F5B20DRAFT_105467 [Whalleya microplaca]|nr:hypothetical protein F5B20DRAFT_105467 [Whalleya microplaca]
MKMRKRDRFLGWLASRFRYKQNAPRLHTSNTDLPIPGESPELKNPIETSSTVGGKSRAPATLWELALEKMSDDERILLGQLDIRCQGDELQQLLDSARQKQAEVEEKAWKVTIRGKTFVLRNVVASITSKLEVMQGLGNHVVQLYPQAALPWATIKLLIQLTIVDQEQQGQLLVGLEAVTVLMCRCQIYESLYLNDSGVDNRAIDQLTQAVVAVYAKIISLLIQAIKIWGKGYAIRAINAFFNSDELVTYLEDLQALENRAEKEAANCERYQLRTTQEEQQRFHEALQDLVDCQFTKLQQSIDQCWKVLETSEQVQIVKWISPIEVKADHNHAKKGLVPDTSEWLLSHSSYLEWRNAPSSQIFWLHGIPGAGKTKLSTKVVDATQSSTHSSLDSEAVAYFYCDKNRADHQDPESIMASLVRQLSVRYDGSAVLDFIRERYKAETSAGAAGRLTIEDCNELLVKLTETYRKVFFVIDGLDECNIHTRRSLMDALDNIRCVSMSIIKVYIASRDDKDIKTRYEQITHHFVSATDNQKDIEKFVVSKMEDNDWCRNNMTQSLRDEITTVFREKSKGIRFQWAVIHITELLSLERESDVREYLHKLPEGLKNAYDTIFDKIMSKKGSIPVIAARAFQWMICSFNEPPNPEKLVWLVCQDLDKDFAPHIDITVDYVLDACNNLIVIEEEKDIYRLCRFSHLSVLEYFEKQHWPESYCHYQASRVCLKCLMYQAENLGTTSFKAPKNSRPNDIFAFEWTRHYFRCNEWQIHINELIDQFIGDIHDSSLAYRYWISNVNYAVSTFLYGPLNEAVFGCVCMGFVGYVQKWLLAGLVSANAMINHPPTDCSYSLLALAAKFCRFEMCELLIASGAKVNSVDDAAGLQISPLQAAVSHIYGLPWETLRVVKLLLDNGADVNQKFSYSQEELKFVLHRAIALRDAKLIELLLQYGAQVDPEDPDTAETTLQIASRRYYNIECIKCLIRYGANINRVGGRDRRTPLEHACCWNCEELVEYMLAHGAKVHIQENDGIIRTPLRVASNHGIIRMLIKHGICASDGLGRLLPRPKRSSSAAIRSWKAGMKEVARETLLIETYGADINYRSNLDGKTPLEAAVCYEHNEAIVEYLIDLGADVNSMSDKYGTQLHIALEFLGPGQMTDLLISRGAEVNIRGGLRNKTAEEILSENAPQVVDNQGFDISTHKTQVFVRAEGNFFSQDRVFFRIVN